MDYDELNALDLELDRQLGALDARLGAIRAENEAQWFRAQSADGRVDVVVEYDGWVSGIHLPHGLARDARSANRPVAEEMTSLGAAIAEAVNTARGEAARAAGALLRQEFPAAFELLRDLEPGGDRN